MEYFVKVGKYLTERNILFSRYIIIIYVLCRRRLKRQNGVKVRSKYSFKPKYSIKILWQNELSKNFCIISVLLVNFLAFFPDTPQKPFYLKKFGRLLIHCSSILLKSTSVKESPFRKIKCYSHIPKCSRLAIVRILNIYFNKCISKPRNFLTFIFVSIDFPYIFLTDIDFRTNQICKWYYHLAYIGRTRICSILSIISKTISSVIQYVVFRSSFVNVNVFLFSLPNNRMIKKSMPNQCCIYYY